MQIDVFAPAKVNLALHVTGRRADGYHLLDTLVVFAPVGDWLSLKPAAQMRLQVTGPEAQGVPDGPDNLVLRAAALVAGEGAAEVQLGKYLPSASGIGGGSSDAAAMIRALAMLRGQSVTAQGAELLGADVPMCLTPAPARAQGIGDHLTPVDLPSLPALLVNPRVQVSTPAVFKALQTRENPPLPAVIPAFAGRADCLSWLAQQRNDLEAAACALAPQISVVLEALAAQPGAQLVRMSGSGATCFALFATEAEAEAAQASLRSLFPQWWCAAALLGDQRSRAAPTQITG